MKFLFVNFSGLSNKTKKPDELLIIYCFSWGVCHPAEEILLSPAILLNLKTMRFTGSVSMQKVESPKTFNIFVYL